VSEASPLRELLESLAEYNVAAGIVLGPDPLANDHGEQRDVVAVQPERFRPAAVALAQSRAYGARWRKARGSLVAWKNLTGTQSDEDRLWVDLCVELGALSLVRVDFPMPFNRGFECFLLGTRELSERRDVHAIVYAAQSAWLEVKEEVVVNRLRISPREREVLLLLAAGATAKAAGEVLGCKERTVSFHITNAMSKLRVRNRGLLIQRACSLGII
jgi:DNA-binding CsgD family transcriptional regulator